MKNVLRLSLVVSAFFSFAMFAYADVAVTTETTVNFTKDGKPVEGKVDYEVTCYGYSSYPGEEDFLTEKEPGTYTPEKVYSYSASCPSFGCKIYEGYYLNYKYIDYCDLKGTYNGEDFELKNFAKSPVPQCDDFQQYDEATWDSEGGVYYKHTDEYDQCLEDSDYDFDGCEQYMEVIPESQIKKDPDGSPIDRVCVADFAISGAPGFSDVPKTNGNYDAINYVKASGIVKGYDDGTYKPDKTINRAEFLKILIEATYEDEEIDTCDKDKNFFKDSPKEEWYGKYLCVGKKELIVSGYADGSFKPGSEINFVEAAKIIVNAFKYEFKEVAGEWYIAFVKVLEEKMSVPDSIDSYEKKLTRGEMAEMIYRLKEAITDKPAVKPTQDWKMFNQPKIILQAK